MGTEFNFGNVITGGALEFVSKTTISNDATLEVTGLEAGYDYIFSFQNLAFATDAVPLRMRTSSNGGSSYDSGGSDYAIYADATSDYMPLTESVGNATGEGASLDVVIYNPGDSSVYTYVGISGGIWFNLNGTNNCAYGYGGKRNSAAIVDAVQFYASSGNLASGTLNVYRRKLST